MLCWAVGWGLAVLTWALPGVPAWLGGHVPGAGLLRDGSRLLLLCAPLLVVLTAHGAVELGRLLRRAGPLRGTVAAVLVVLPVTLLPGLALGAAGRLDPVDYPTEYAQVRDLLADRDTYGDGDVLLLPLSSYRQPGWNDRRKVLDPLGRYLRRDYVASDVLVVSGRAIDGEDPRVGQVAAALRPDSCRHPSMSRSLRRDRLEQCGPDRCCSPEPHSTPRRCRWVRSSGLRHPPGRRSHPS